MIPDPAVMRDLALQTEAELHREGWDEVPALFGPIHATRGGVTAKAMQTPVHPAEYLMMAAHALTVPMSRHPRLREQTFQQLAVPELAGLLFATEAWRAPLNHNPVKDRRPYADVPGSVEMRHVFVVDVAGRMFTVWRERGKPPVAERGDGETCVAGRIPGAMVKILAALAARMPLGSADLNGLARAMEQVEEGERKVEEQFEREQ